MLLISSKEMKQCKDNEQLVKLYGEMKEMCNKHQKPHQGAYVKDYTHYWHNILKDHLTKWVLFPHFIVKPFFIISIFLTLKASVWLQSHLMENDTF